LSYFDILLVIGNLLFEEGALYFGGLGFWAFFGVDVGSRLDGYA
jgi:hypothetical protein